MEDDAKRRWLEAVELARIRYDETQARIEDTRIANTGLTRWLGIV